MPSLSKMKESLNRPVSMPKPKAPSRKRAKPSASSKPKAAAKAKAAVKPKSISSKLTAKSKAASKPTSSARRRGSVGHPARRRGRGGSGVVGLDIQPGYVAAVEASVNGVVSVQRAVGAPLPADTVREGEVLDEKLLADTLRELFRDGRMSRRVRVGLANQRTVVRIMELPPITDRKELMAAVNFQAADQIPMPLASAVLDFHPLGIVDTPSGKRQRVVVAAAQREMVERLVSAVTAAGLRPVGVDLSAFAMIRALHRGSEDAELESAASDATETLGLPGSSDRDPAATDEGASVGDTGSTSAAGSDPPHASAIDAIDGLSRPNDGGAASQAGGPANATPDGAVATGQGGRTLYLNVGGLTNLAIAEGVTCRFTRTVGGGLEAMASQLAERQSIALAEARALLSEVDLTASPDGSDPARVDADAVMRTGVREIAGEVRNSLDFHRAQESGGAVEDVILSGTCLEISGFAAALESELGHRVRRRVVALGRGGDFESVPAERLTIAAGLAVEEVAP